MRYTEEFSQQLFTQARVLRDAEQLGNTRGLFFAQVETVRGHVVYTLKKSRAVKSEDVLRCDQLFDGIMSNRTKSQGADGVYWPGVITPYRTVIAEIERLALEILRSSVPWHLSTLHFVRKNALAIVAIIFAVASLLYSVCKSNGG